MKFYPIKITTSACIEARVVRIEARVWCIYRGYILSHKSDLGIPSGDILRVYCSVPSVSWYIYVALRTLYYGAEYVLLYIYTTLIYPDNLYSRKYLNRFLFFNSQLLKENIRIMVFPVNSSHGDNFDRS